MSDGLTDKRGQGAPTVGEFKNDARLILLPAPNGGWTVSQAPTGSGYEATLVGAYSSAADMLSALSDYLTPPR